MAQTDGEVAYLESASAQQLIDRAPSAVSQHSRPLADPEHDREIAPQLRIVQSLAETGTTHGDGPLNHTGNHIARTSPNPGAPGLDSETWVSTTSQTSRPEGDA